MHQDAVIASLRGKRFRDRYSTESVDNVLRVAAISALLLTAASYFGNSYWLFELLTHFRLQFVAGSVILLSGALLRRRSATAILAAVAAVANISPLVPYVMPGAGAAEAGQFHIRLMAANVNYRNFDYAALREAIRRENPDVVGLLEVNETWVTELSSIQSDYPYTILRPAEGAYGLALFSRLPVHELQGSPYVHEGFPTAIAVELELRQVPVTMVLAHLRAPTTPEKASLRNAQLERITAMFGADTNAEQVLIGDLNITPWSPHYPPLETAAHLTNAARGRGYMPTWPTGFSFLKIPIDHCLVSDGLRVQQFRTGTDIGSDHLPIIIDVTTDNME